MSTHIGFIGGGNMASSLIGGLLDSSTAGAPVPISVFEPNGEQAAKLQARFSINLASSNEELLSNCDVIVVAVKPQVLHSVLSPLANAFQAQQPLLVSIVAGIRASTISEWLNGDIAIVRAMPNTPALVGAGAAGLYANDMVNDAQKKLAETLLNAVGISRWVKHEADIDSVTALSGSGPAYFMLFTQSLIDAGIAAGLDTQTANSLAVQTARGSAELISQSDESLQTLIDNVTSPGGTTERALQSFAADQLTDIVAKAFTAAQRRSEELADELSKN